MRINKLNIALLLGFAVITGIMILQFFLLRQAVQYEEKKFDQKTHVALQEAVTKLNSENKATVAQKDPVEKIKDDYYIGNVNGKFENSSLDFYLKNEFDKFDLITDFEYGIYDCHAEVMHYGNYVSVAGKADPKKTNFSPMKNYGPYYFAVHFPYQSKYIYKSLRIWIIFSFIMFIVLILYGYSAFTILQQKKYSELQKDFINNMTHEFKTPISSVLIASDFLSKQDAVLHDEKLKRYTKLISEQTTRLNHHVEKVLSLARTENSPLEMNKTATDIIPVVNAAVENILLKYPDAQIRINAPEKCIVKADSFHLSNLIYNLLDNSVKYSEAVPQITISIAKQQNNIKLSVADKGIGIPEKEMQKVFDKFYRVNSRRSNEIAGFGLGLFYVHRICKEHKWSLSLDSCENQGTEISILMPAYDKKI